MPSPSEASGSQPRRVQPSVDVDYELAQSLQKAYDEEFVQGEPDDDIEPDENMDIGEEFDLDEDIDPDEDTSDMDVEPEMSKVQGKQKAMYQDPQPAKGKGSKKFDKSKKSKRSKGKEPNLRQSTLSFRDGGLAVNRPRQPAASDARASKKKGSRQVAKLDKSVGAKQLSSRGRIQTSRRLTARTGTHVGSHTVSGPRAVRSDIEFQAISRPLMLRPLLILKTPSLKTIADPVP